MLKMSEQQLKKGEFTAPMRWKTTGAINAERHKRRGTNRLLPESSPDRPTPITVDGAGATGLKRRRVSQGTMPAGHSAT
jgi:hypothetical protein